MSAARLLEYFSINMDIQEELVGIGHVILFNVIYKKRHNLWGLHYWCFPEKLRFLKNSRIIHPKLKKTCNFGKKRHQHRCFPVNITKLFRTPILKKICERLLLKQLAILKNTSEQLLLTLSLNSKNLLTSYQQLSYYQFNVT